MLLRPGVDAERGLRERLEVLVVGPELEALEPEVAGGPLELAHGAGVVRVHRREPDPVAWVVRDERGRLVVDARGIVGQAGAPRCRRDQARDRDVHAGLRGHRREVGPGRRGDRPRGPAATRCWRRAPPGERDRDGSACGCGRRRSRGRWRQGEAMPGSGLGTGSIERDLAVANGHEVRDLVVGVGIARDAPTGPRR